MSVHRRRGGKRQRWVWIVMWRDHAGRQCSKTYYAREDADEADLELRRRRSLGAHSSPAPAVLPLADWLDKWWRRESPRWRQSTRNQRGWLLDLYVRPYLGAARLRDLGRAEVKDWHSEIHANGAPVQQANKALSVLSAALGHAVEDRLMPANPCVGVKRFKFDAPLPRAIAPIDVERVRLRMAPRDALIVSLMAWAGLRSEEVFALRWRCVEEHYIRVEASYSAGELSDRTKAGGARDVELVEPLRAELEAYRPAGAFPGSLVVVNEATKPIDLRLWRRRVW